MNEIPENDIFIPGACAESFPVANHAPSPRAKLRHPPSASNWRKEALR